jgi:V/A-type H+/Na+-transporting ATPase subunit K
MRKQIFPKVLLAFLALMWVLSFVPHVAAQGDAITAEAAAAQARGLIAIGAGLAVGLTGIGSAWGEASIGAAAMGAIAENEALFGRGLIMTVIPETIVIFGLVVSILLLFVF